MSNEAQGLVRNLALQAPHKPILMAYANYADESGYCWPSVEVIAFDTGFSEPTVKRTRRELIAAGWMGTKRRFGTTAATRLNLPQIAAAGVDRGDRTRLKHEIEFEPAVEESAGQRLRDQSDPNERPRTPRRRKPAGQHLRDHSDPNGTRSDQSDPNEGITMIRTRDQSDPLSITDPSQDPSVEAGTDRTTEKPSQEQTAADWAMALIAGLEFRPKRPNHREAVALARLVESAERDHGLTRAEIRRHCRATLNEATVSGVAYLKGGLQADRLPLPLPMPLPKGSPQRDAEPAAPAESLTAEELLARGLKLELLPTRLREAAAQPPNAR